MFTSSFIYTYNLSHNLGKKSFAKTLDHTVKLMIFMIKNFISLFNQSILIIKVSQMVSYIFWLTTLYYNSSRHAYHFTTYTPSRASRDAP